MIPAGKWETGEFDELVAEERYFVYGPASDHGADASEQEGFEDSNITPESTSSTFNSSALSSCEENLENPSEIASPPISRSYTLAQLNVRLHWLSDLFSVEDEAEDEE